MKFRMIKLYFSRRVKPIDFSSLGFYVDKFHTYNNLDTKKKIFFCLLSRYIIEIILYYTIY